MTRGTPILRGYRGVLAVSLVFGAGVLVGHDDTQPVPVPVAQTVSASDQSAPSSLPATDQGAASAVPSDAPVANLIALRSMDPGDQERFLSRMTDPQLVALQTVAVTTPGVLPQANDEALNRGLPEMVAGGKNSYGAVQAVPLDPSSGALPAPQTPDPAYTPAPAPAPQAVDPCDYDDCTVVSV